MLGCGFRGAYVYKKLTARKGSHNDYTCLNKNHRDVTLAIKSFNKILAARLIAASDQPKLQFADDDTWVEVFPDVFVYSAFLEESQAGTWQVRLISVVRKDLAMLQRSPIDVQCWVGAGTAVFLAEAGFRLVPEDHDLPYSAAFFTCPGHSGALIRLHKWNLSLNKSLILEYGQLAAVQDCIYRSRFVSEYLMSVDFDEFLVPRKKRSIPEALLSIETAVGKNVLGSMVIQNQFFCREYPYNSALLRQVPPLLSLIENVREAIPWEHNVRSKYITRPNATVVGGVHFVWEHRPG
ncbi:hypothetical protein IscW_ISCW022056, partial [Ixodes scapularis]